MPHQNSHRNRLSLGAFLAVTVAVISMGAGALAASVDIDGQAVTPVIARDGRLFVPFRAPMERVGAVVAWKNPTATATYHGEQLVTLNNGDTSEIVKGSTHSLTVAPVLIQESLFVPVDALTDICGGKVTYSADRQSATVAGCTLEGVAAVAAAAPVVPVAQPVVPETSAFNFWPWLLLLLAAIVAVVIWASRRTKTVYSTSAYSPTKDQTVTTVREDVPGTTPAADYASRVQRAVDGMDEARRASFAQGLGQTVRENEASMPEGVMQSAKAALAGAPSMTAITSVITLFRDRPQLLQAAVQKFAATHPGELRNLLGGVTSASH